MRSEVVNKNQNNLDNITAGDFHLATTYVPSGCAVVTVGSYCCGNPQKTVSCGNTCDCPYNINRYNWYGDETYDDTFTASYAGNNQVTVTRICNCDGWGMNLQIICCASPTAAPIAKPTFAPSAKPTFAPSAEPTFAPNAEPTFVPTASPTELPTVAPSAKPTLTQENPNQYIESETSDGPKRFVCPRPANKTKLTFVACTLE